MSVWLTDEQQLIKDSAERLVQNDYTIEARQKLIESEHRIDGFFGVRIRHNVSVRSKLPLQTTTCSSLSR